MTWHYSTELRQVVDDPKNLQPGSVLETLPYLNAVIYEGLRLSYGVSFRTARIAAEEGPGVQRSPVEYVIPRWTAIGMSAATTHHDERVYPTLVCTRRPMGEWLVTTTRRSPGRSRRAKRPG
ncbi:hypothetical protein PpBr36_04289 [Pyricularia pennisetigena]|uniref:hypothetical protein n=1 Tax=Pyricularia pennisetigena TaxID=1578925 RepID=UPI00115357EF|nr:hypothetical protein PpBr36_04289 [Pyricularia pennisetigena]TLS26747.1 hypothetical protein PpBr36_04289 [Pyricularia pennisetigena]